MDVTTFAIGIAEKPVFGKGVIMIVMAILVYLLAKKGMKKGLILFLLLLLPLYSLLARGVYESGDMAINVVKAMSFYKALSEGQLIPNWSGEANATYGYPLFIFTYPLPYYGISLFHWLGLSFIASVKAVMATAYLLSGMTFYWYAKKHFSPLIALSTTLFYAFAPYLLIDMHYRVALGELLSFGFLPLTLGLTEVMLETKKIRYAIFLVVSLGMLLLSHQAVSLIYFPILAGYGLLIPAKKKLRWIGGVFILALGLTAYYWLPVITETKYTLQPEYAKTVAFWPLASYLFSPWRNGWLWQGPGGELVFPIGYVHLPLILTSAYLMIKKD